MLRFLARGTIGAVRPSADQVWIAAQCESFCGTQAFQNCAGLCSAHETLNSWRKSPNAFAWAI